MLPIPRRSSTRQPSKPSTQSNRLIHELGLFENRLQEWIALSHKNASWFRRDPLAAMRAAGLDIDDELMCELETIMGGLARKLKS
jgi:hypothetical protein